MTESLVNLVYLGGASGACAGLAAGFVLPGVERGPAYLSRIMGSGSSIEAGHDPFIGWPGYTG